MNEHRQELKKLEGILERCGADPRHWPQAERTALLAFIKSDERARALLHEARALANLLDAAPLARDTGRLKSGILDAIGNLPQEPAETTVIAFPKPALRAQNTAGRWGVAALLAASLLIGIWVGAAGFAETLVRVPLEVAGMDLGDQISPEYVGGISTDEELL